MINHIKLEEAIAKIVKLCYRINTTTEYAAFFDMSGHTEQIDIIVGKGKENEKEWNNKVFRSETIYLEESSAQQELAEVIIELNLILADAPKHITKRARSVK